MFPSGSSLVTNTSELAKVPMSNAPPEALNEFTLVKAGGPSGVEVLNPSRVITIRDMEVA